MASSRLFFIGDEKSGRSIMIRPVNDAKQFGLNAPHVQWNRFGHCKSVYEGAKFHTLPKNMLHTPARK